MPISDLAANSEGLDERHEGDEQDDIELPDQLDASSTNEGRGYDLYRIYRSYVEHEDDLVNQRLYRLFIAHASLAAATGVIISKISDIDLGRVVPQALMLFGGLSLMLCYTQYLAIRAGCRAIEKLAAKWGRVKRHVRGGHLLPSVVGGGDLRNDRIGRRTALAAPVILAMFWIIAIAGGIYFWHARVHPVPLVPHPPG